jgi:hypothetical protein
MLGKKRRAYSEPVEAVLKFEFRVTIDCLDNAIAGSLARLQLEAAAIRTATAAGYGLPRCGSPRPVAGDRMRQAPTEPVGPHPAMKTDARHTGD